MLGRKGIYTSFHLSSVTSGRLEAGAWLEATILLMSEISPPRLAMIRGVDAFITGEMGAKEGQGIPPSRCPKEHMFPLGCFCFQHFTKCGESNH